MAMYIRNNPSAQLTLTFPISPRIVIILRMSLLSIEQDMKFTDPEFTGFSYFNSYFADFPRRTAVVDYNPPLSKATEKVRQKLAQGVSLESLTLDERRVYEDWERGIVDGTRLISRENTEDTLTFTVDRLSREQGKRVNCLFLDNCRERLAFISPAALEESLAAYDAEIGMWKRNWNVLRTKLAELREPPLPSAGTHVVQGGAPRGMDDGEGEEAVSKPKKKFKKKKKKVDMSSAVTVPAEVLRDPQLHAAGTDDQGAPSEGAKDARDEVETATPNKKSKQKKKKKKKEGTALHSEVIVTATLKGPSNPPSVSEEMTKGSSGEIGPGSTAEAKVQ